MRHSSFLASVSQLPFPVRVVTRLRLDAALYEPAPPRKPKQIGRPRLVGKRNPTPATVLHHQKTQWQRVMLPHWYGAQPRVLEIASQTAVWYHTGLTPVPIRWVLVRDPLGQFDPQAFLCTNLDATPSQIVTWFCQRWQLEVTFEEVRAHLGVETQRQWSDDRDPENHASFARTVFSGGLVRASDQFAAVLATPTVRLVSQISSHLFRCARTSSLSSVGVSTFSDIRFAHYLG